MDPARLLLDIQEMDTAIDRLTALNDELGVDMEPETIALIEELERAARRVQAS